MVMLAFSVFDQKYRFWANCVQKIKIVTLSWNLVVWLIEYAEFSGDALFFSFRPEIPFLVKYGDTHFFCFRLVTLFLGKFGPKNQNCVFKLKFGILTNLNMQNSMEMLTFLY